MSVGVVAGLLAWVGLTGGGLAVTTEVRLGIGGLPVYGQLGWLLGSGLLAVGGVTLRWFLLALRRVARLLGGLVCWLRPLTAWGILLRIVRATPVVVAHRCLQSH